MLKVISTYIKTLVDRSDLGISHYFKGSGAITNGCTGIKNALVKCLLIFN